MEDLHDNHELSTHFMKSDWLNMKCLDVEMTIPCMVVNSIMSQTTLAISFYRKCFGHVTNYTCVLHEYPCGFVLSHDQLSIFDD